MATVARLVAELHANTVNFDQGFGRATKTVGNFAFNVDQSTRGMKLVERGLENIAFRAVGIEGPIGTVTKGLLAFSGASAPILLVAGALGAVALAWKGVAEASKVAAEEHAKAMTLMTPAQQNFQTAKRLTHDEHGNQNWFSMPEWFSTMIGNVQAGRLGMSEAGGGPAQSSLAANIIRSWGSTTSGPFAFNPSLVRTRNAPLSLSASDARRFAGIQVQTGFDNFNMRPEDSGLFKFQGITGQSAALAGINALGGALSGGGIGSLLSGGLSLAGGAFGPLGSAFGGLLGQAFGGLFGGGEDPAVRELKRLVAIQQRQLDYAERQYKAMEVLILSSSETNPAAIDRLAREVNDASDRGVVIRVVR